MNTVETLGAMPGEALDVVLAGLTDDELIGALDELNDLSAENLGQIGAGRVRIVNVPGRGASYSAQRINRAQARVRDHAAWRGLHARNYPVYDSTGGQRFVYKSDLRGLPSPQSAIDAADAMRDQLYGLGEVDGTILPEPAGIGEYVVDIEGAGEPVAEVDGMGAWSPAGENAVFVADNSGPYVATTIDALGHERTRRGRIDQAPSTDGLGSWLSKTLKRNKRTLGTITGILGPVAAATGVGAPIAAASGFLGPVLSSAGQSSAPRTQTVSFGGIPGVQVQVPTVELPIPGGGRIVLNPVDVLTGGRQGSAPGRQGSPAPAPAPSTRPAAPALRQGMTPQQQSQAMYRESRWRTMPGTFDPFGTRGQPAPASTPTVTLGPPAPSSPAAPPPGADPGFAFGPGSNPWAWLNPQPRPTSPGGGGSSAPRAPRGTLKVEDDVAVRGGFAEALSSPLVLLGGVAILALALSRK